MLQAVCDRLPARAPVARAQAIAGMVLSPAAGLVVAVLDPDTPPTHDVVRRADGRAVAVPDTLRYATPELLAVEAAALAGAVARRDERVGAAGHQITAGVLAARTSL